jgi:curved DNA-binding protein CbpA
MAIRDELERYVIELLLAKGHAPETVIVEIDQLWKFDIDSVSHDVVAGFFPIEHARHILYTRIEQYLSTAPFFYRILGISQYASLSEIKSAHNRLSLMYHPDRCHEPDCAAKFRQIDDAYKTLSDPTKRARYDEFEEQYGKPEREPRTARKPRVQQPEYEDPFVIEVRRSDTPTGVRLLLKHFWPEIIGSGIDNFFVSHPEFGVPFPTKSLVTAFVQIVHTQLRANLSRDESAPFELIVLGGLSGSSILIYTLLISGMNSDVFKNALAGQFERQYRQEAHLYGSAYATSSTDQFVTGFCAWLKSYRPFAAKGAAAE